MLSIFVFSFLRHHDDEKWEIGWWLFYFCLVIFRCDWLLHPELLGEAIEEYISHYFVDESFIVNLIMKGQHLSGLSSIESNPFLFNFQGDICFALPLLLNQNTFLVMIFISVFLKFPPFFCSRQSPSLEDGITCIPLGRKALR